MSDLIKDNWFVILIAVIIIAFVGYFIFDSNKDNVTAKTSESKDVLATLADTDITADALYDATHRSMAIYYIICIATRWSNRA